MKPEVDVCHSRGMTEFETPTSRDGLALNRALWDVRARVHGSTAADRFYNVETFLAGRQTLCALERELAGEVAGKDLLHLQCHFGIDTLSWTRLGARVTGVDYSEVAIDLARSLAAELGLDARFIRSDVLDLPTVLTDQFDVVYTSRGVLAWLPDLRTWSRVIARFLRPGGTFYITEEHPFMHVFADDAKLRVENDYFRGPEPAAWPVVGSYADPTA